MLDINSDYKITNTFQGHSFNLTYNHNEYIGQQAIAGLLGLPISRLDQVGKYRLPEL
jgi:hypothetical protein